jgi:hypothetical protein
VNDAQPQPATGEPPLLLVRGGATEEEVAALVAVLQGISAAAASAAEPPRRRSEWGSPVRRLRTTYPSGPGAWRASGLPR